jgi:penicillin-binding protein 2
MARKNPHTRNRYIIIGIFITLFSIFALKLFYVQVLSDKYRLLSDSNVRRILTIFPARGIIYDRNGKKIVSNEDAYDLMVIPRQVIKPDTMALCQLLEIDKQSFKQRLKKAKEYSPYKASVFLEQISRQSFGFLQEKLFRFPGFFVQPRTIRLYPYPVAAHVLGYVGEVKTISIRTTITVKGITLGKAG